MCIIVYKPAGVTLPPRETLKNCFDNNPDGAGLMLRRDDGYTLTEKGFFNLEELLTRLDYYDKKLDLEARDVALHFRIATHGGINSKNCHPFIISTNKKTARRLQRNKTGAALMHNGVLHSVETFKDYSDTCVYTADIVAPLQALANNDREHLTENRHAQNVLNATRGASRLLIFDRAGVCMFGDYICDKGVYYSNDTYKYNLNDWTYTSFKDSRNDDYLDDWEPLKPGRLFDSCAFCENYDDCKVNGAMCYDEDDAWIHATEQYYKGA